MITVSLALCVAAISSDIIVLLVTWRRTVGTYLETRKINIRTPLLFCLLRDGKRYVPSFHDLYSLSEARYIVLLVGAF